LIANDAEVNVSLVTNRSFLSHDRRGLEAMGWASTVLGHGCLGYALSRVSARCGRRTSMIHSQGTNIHLDQPLPKGYYYQTHWWNSKSICLADIWHNVWLDSRERSRRRAVPVPRAKSFPGGLLNTVSGYRSSISSISWYRPYHQVCAVCFRSGGIDPPFRSRQLPEGII